MNKKTILWTISLIILGIATVYGTLYYLQWRDKKLWEKEEQKEETEIIKPEEPITQEMKDNQLKEIEKLKQEINLELPSTEKTITEQIQDLNIINQQQEIIKPAQQQAESQQPEPITLTPEEQ